MDDFYCDGVDMAYSNYSSDDIQWQGYLTSNIIQFNLLAVLTQNQIPMKYTLDFPILAHYPPNASRSLRKSNPMGGFAFA